LAVAGKWVEDNARVRKMEFMASELSLVLEDLRAMNQAAQFEPTPQWLRVRDTRRDRRA
jgi:hypothetical protein